MTVQYYQNVLTSGPVVFFKLLLRWRGCVIKLVYLDLIVFAALYTLISCIYRFALNSTQMRSFETIIIYVSKFQSMIPISFILGFYVGLVFKRFWNHFNAIPWLLKYTMTLTTFLNAQTLQAKLLRKSMVRYMNAALIITATRLHISAKKRFPTFDSLIKAGILTEKESYIIENSKPIQSQPFVPVIWSVQLLTHAEREGLINNPFGYVSTVLEIDSFRSGLLRLFLTDQVCVPLVYTQVVTLAVYSYFVSCLVGHQFIVSDSCLASANSPDMYVPIVTLIEFIIYMGWLKVAETLVNPMGEDDEDFDINEIIDFNWKVTMHMAEGSDIQAPAPIKDKHWFKNHVELPHTVASIKLRSDPYMGSTYDLNISNLPHELRASQVSIQKDSSTSVPPLHLGSLGILPSDNNVMVRHRSDICRPNNLLTSNIIRERADSLFTDDFQPMDPLLSTHSVLSPLLESYEKSSSGNMTSTDSSLNIPVSGPTSVHHITEPIAEEDEEEMAQILREEPMNSNIHTADDNTVQQVILNESLNLENLDNNNKDTGITDIKLKS